MTYVMLSGKISLTFNILLHFRDFFMNYFIIIASMLSICFSGLHSQQTQINKEQYRKKSEVIKKTLIESKEMGQEYVINYSSNFKEKIIDRLSSEDNARLIQLQQQGLKDKYDTLYSILLSGIVHKNSDTQAQFNKILPDIANTQYSAKPEHYRQIAWWAVNSGYTVNLLEEFQQQGVKVMEIFSNPINVKNPWEQLVITSPLIVKGKITAVRTDTTFQDNCMFSYELMPNEILKGDTTIKKIVIRENVRSHNFSASVNVEYILFLNKSVYDYASIQNLASQDNGICNNCYKASFISIPISYKGILFDDKKNLQNEKFTRELCKNYASIFNKMRK
jgi:hypothetical protein